MKPSRRTLTENGPKQWTIRPLAADDHKYSRGHVLVWGGTMTGAAKLAAWAAQRAGAGMVTIASTPTAWTIYASSMASVLTRALDKPGDWAWILKHRKVSAVVLGPGAEPLELRAPLLAAIKQEKPLVLDAGALELLAKAPALREKLTGMSFLCLPHEGEYRRLAEALGLDTTAAKPARTRALAAALGGVVVLKGAETIIAAPDGRTLRQRISAPWLATAGTGDVLAGIAGALLSQGMEPFEAAAAAVWLHAEAASHHGPGMIAEDLLMSLPLALGEVLS